MLIALALGFFALIAYGLKRGHKFFALTKMALGGIAPFFNIAVVMLLVGALTALWRSCGTIAFVVSSASDLISPSMFLPVSFLLCAMVSVLTGTSVGTAATMGAICMSVGCAMGISPAVCGGAVLSGSYFGDRCSPVSTSALLVAEITHTRLYANIRGMVRTGLLPTLFTLLFFMVLGLFCGSNDSAYNLIDVFEAHYGLSWYMALPAISIVLLALLRLDVKINMVVSILLSMVICVIRSISLDFSFAMQDSIFGTLDHFTSIMHNNMAQMTSIPAYFKETFHIMLYGYEAPAELASMLSGGGVFSMVKLICVVLISLTYAGLFKGLGILDKLHVKVLGLAQKVSPFGCFVLTSFATSALACNQTLSIVLTNEICSAVEPDEKKRAISLENSAVIIAPLVPWTVASLVPLAAMGAPSTSIFFAGFLYIVPAVCWFFDKKKNAGSEKVDEEVIESATSENSEETSV